MPTDIDRVLTVTVQVKINDRRMSDSRMREAYERAAAAATFAVQDTLLPGSVAGVRTRMSYDYRHAEEVDDAFKPVDQYDWSAQQAA